MGQIRRALLKAFALALCGGTANAESLCQTERPPNQRAFHCIEMGSKRFRIPDGHLAFWQLPDPKTGRIERFDTMADEVRGKFTYFFFVSDLPDLTETHFRNPANRDDLSRRLTSIVMRQREALFPIMVEQKEGTYVFSERLVDYFVSRGYERATPSSPLRKGDTSYTLIPSTMGIAEIVKESPDWGLQCFHPYALDVMVATTVVGGDARARACFHGRRVVEKLRSFEY